MRAPVCLGDAFIAPIKTMIAPIIFCTVVHGIATMGDLKRFGRIGVKALVYFEVVSTFALAIGLVVAAVVGPGRGFNVDPSKLNTASVRASAVSSRPGKSRGRAAFDGAGKTSHERSAIDVLKCVAPARHGRRGPIQRLGCALSLRVRTPER